MQFPDESSHRAAIAGQLAGEFSYARRLLDYWLSADKDRGLAKSELSPVVLRVAFAMSVKATRQFRTVYDLCQRGEAVDAAAIARSLFESALAVHFVLKPRFTPRVFRKNGTVQTTIRVPGRRLTREFRATLFLTHYVLRPEQEANKHKDRPGMKREARRMAKLAAAGISTDYTNAIGPEWTKILKDPPWTYSGLSIANQARSLGEPFPKWYDQIYGHQSQHVHAGDMPYHIEIDDDATTRPNWQDSVQHTRISLLSAVAMFYATIAMMNREIGFGVAMNTALHGFAREYQEMLANL